MTALCFMNIFSMAGNKYFIVRSVGVTVNVECACLCVHALQPME